MREGTSVQLLNELYAETGEVGFICHTRLDVAAVYASAFAVLQGAPAAELPPAMAWQRTGRRCRNNTGSQGSEAKAL